MLGNKNRMLLQSIKTFVARDARQKLQKIVEKAHPADLALVAGHLRVSEARKVIELLTSAEAKARVLSETKPELAAEILHETPPRETSLILQEMYSDDSAQILEAFDEELREAILREMKEDESQEVEKRLEYEGETAGRIMVPDFLALPADTTVAESIAALQNAEDVELVYYLYVVGEGGQLVGVVSLRQLLLVGPQARLRDIMVRDVITAKVHEDQEDVARRVARYNLVAIPVVDDLGRMLGVITVDDVIDVIREEATEDLFKMAGASGEDPLVNASVLTSLRTRWPWLLASCFGGLCAYFVIQRFEEPLLKMSLLAGFIPVVLGLGGNVGAQASTVVARGLATGLLDSSQTLAVTFKELRVGVLLGLLYGGLIALFVLGLRRAGLFAELGPRALVLAAVSGLGVFASMVAAAVAGSLIPLVLDRLRIDPAIATGPLVTSAVDVLGVLAYFSVATALLGL
jgi:magnesium transporter